MIRNIEKVKQITNVNCIAQRTGLSKMFTFDLLSVSTTRTY
jgi:hypothetical protein